MADREVITDGVCEIENRYGRAAKRCKLINTCDYYNRAPRQVTGRPSRRPILMDNSERKQVIAPKYFFVLKRIIFYVASSQYCPLLPVNLLS